MLSENSGPRSDVERCPQYNETYESSDARSTDGECQRSRVPFLPHPMVSYKWSSRLASSREGFGEAANLPSHMAARRVFAVLAAIDASSRSPENGIKGLDFGSPNTQAIPQSRIDCPFDSLEREAPFAEGNERPHANSTTPSNLCLAPSQENPNRGRRKEVDDNSLLHAALVGPPERASLEKLPPQPTTRHSQCKKGIVDDNSLCFGHDKLHISASRRPPTPSPLRRSKFRLTAMRTTIRVVDLSTLLLGYILTFAIVNSQNPDNGWAMDLPLMQLLPSSLTNPSQLAMLLQIATWSLIGMFHLLRSPRYWPECGLVAIGVSVVAGGWFGLIAMVDSLTITAFTSLLVAKAIEWVSENRPAAVRGTLPLSQQDYRP